MGRVATELVFDLTYYPVIFLTICIHVYLYKKVFPLLSPKLSKSYSTLSVADQKEWDSRMVSSLHATIVSAICIYNLLYDEEVYNDPIWSDRPLIRINCAILTGFVIADTVIMMIDSPLNLEAVMYYFHHGSAAYAYYYVFSYGVLSYFANFRIMAEFSTVFVNFRWFFDKVNYDKTGTLFIVNGCVMTFTFISARVLSMPKYWFMVYTYIGSEDFALLGKIANVMILTCFVLDILNIKWSIRMLKGAHKVVLAKFDKNKNEVSESQKNGKQL
ncbi:TLC domain-containing protein 4-B-like [Ylistrum balloti]|uniref:TLC domain-containing protein 4-B-like n=1 Tax=Ylistrum balloti TaxID=509963 RepID=UPI002905D8D0|nr:TLC domain-containing protein 4-B-like [Ylistrum balloti]